MRVLDKFKDRDKTWNKFIDHYVHFESMRTEMKTRDKFKSQNESVGQV